MSKEGKTSLGLALISVLFREYPRQAILISMFLVLSGLAEGLGIATVMPLISAVAGDTDAETATLTQIVTSVMDFVGLAPTLGNMLIVIVAGMTTKMVLVLLTMVQVATAMSFVSTDMRFRLLRALLLARWSYFVRLPAGDIANAVTSEVNGAGAVFWGATNFCTMLIQVSVYLVLASLVSWTVTLFALFAGGVMFLLLNWLVGQSRRAGVMAMEAYTSLMRRVVDGLGGIKPIKAMAAEDRLDPLLRHDNDALFRATRLQLMSKEAMTSVQEPLIIMFMAVGLFVAATYRVAPFDQLVVMALLFQRTLSRLGRLQAGYQQLVYAQSFYESLNKKTTEAVSEEETSGTKAPLQKWREVSVKGVTFAYPDSAPVLQDVDLTIPTGKVTVIFGPSGSGKSTVADLIMGLQWPDSGDVTIDGLPLREVDLRAWRKMIGYVPQDLFLFNDTIRNNVTLGDPDITVDQIEAAIRDAGAGAFVAAQPEGIDTVVGEKGFQLSGGQRQRLSIARALVRQPRFLILDEPTTALDPVTEAEICRTLRRLTDHLTVLAISHQPAVTEIADVIYNVSGGTVVRSESSPSRRVEAG
jgi:ATP-binding cassette subfamily C protein